MSRVVLLIGLLVAGLPGERRMLVQFGPSGLDPAALYVCFGARDDLLCTRVTDYQQQVCEADAGTTSK